MESQEAQLVTYRCFLTDDTKIEQGKLLDDRRRDVRECFDVCSVVSAPSLSFLRGWFPFACHNTTWFWKRLSLVGCLVEQLLLEWQPKLDMAAISLVLMVVGCFSLLWRCWTVVPE